MVDDTIKGGWATYYIFGILVGGMFACDESVMHKRSSAVGGHFVGR